MHQDHHLGLFWEKKYILNISKLATIVGVGLVRSPIFNHVFYRIGEVKVETTHLTKQRILSVA